MPRCFYLGDSNIHKMKKIFYNISLAILLTVLSRWLVSQYTSGVLFDALKWIFVVPLGFQIIITWLLLTFSEASVSILNKIWEACIQACRFLASIGQQTTRTLWKSRVGKITLIGFLGWGFYLITKILHL